MVEWTEWKCNGCGRVHRVIGHIPPSCPCGGWRNASKGGKDATIPLIAGLVTGFYVWTQTSSMEASFISGIVMAFVAATKWGERLVALAIIAGIGYFIWGR